MSNSNKQSDGPVLFDTVWALAEHRHPGLTKREIAAVLAQTMEETTLPDLNPRIAQLKEYAGDAYPYFARANTSELDETAGAV